MPNWCSNKVEFEGDAQAIAEVNALFKAMEQEEQQTGDAQIPDFIQSEKGFLSLYVDEAENGVVHYQTPWSPNTAVVRQIADRFSVGFAHYYEETGCCIYGVTHYRDGEAIETDLDWRDFERYWYNEEEDQYHFEGETYESDFEILEILLGRMLQETKNI